MNNTVVYGEYNPAFSGIPSYTIITNSDTFVANQEDHISINIFIAGAGDVEANKFEVSIPPYLIKDSVEEEDFFTINNTYVVDEAHYPKYPQKISIWQNKFTKILPDYFFNNNPNFINSTLINTGDLQISKTLSAPLTIDFTIADNAPPGDHEITLNLWYKNASQWYNSQSNIKIHIKYWYESDYLQYLVYASIGIIIIEFIFKLCEMNREKKKEL